MSSLLKKFLGHPTKYTSVYYYQAVLGPDLNTIHAGGVTGVGTTHW